MVPKSDHLANTRFDKKPSAQVTAASAKSEPLAGAKEREDSWH